MPKTQKDSVPQSLEKSTKGLTNVQALSLLKKAKSTPRKNYTPEEQWEIAKKHGILITPTPGVPYPKMQNGPKAPK